ncbi:HD domain-containing phosphohydrolase [Alkalihalobacterium elongatum]|uniref:HD domain-containing phosphohydrolase n=1 Tax=Alkalihalobacterium elongatum TaxID=2675466 RepID=UPI001C1FC43F|nr:HD domain-containing phosphohydrolase [Alkalihalobacterium elongatum]
MAVIKSLPELIKGDILCDDIYFKDKLLLLSAGTVINREAVKKLATWGIRQVNVIEPLGYNGSKETKRKKKDKILYSRQLFDIKQLFYEGLQYVVNESRYGYVLNNDYQLRWLENLFVAIMSDDRISITLFRLKRVDSYSYFHSFDVFLLGSLFAKSLGVEDIKTFATGCLIHDVGKLKIPKEILRKEGKLTKSEFEVMQNHTIYGVEWVRKNNLSPIFEQLIKSHHERLDGSGYPEGLVDHELSTEVRLLSIVDTYSALTLKRPYRDPFTATKAIELLLNKKHKYDLAFLICYIELLNIYPTDSIVKLSNGKTARVKEVNETQPYRPILEELDGSGIFELPVNLSVTIPKFIKWDSIYEWDQKNDNHLRENFWGNYLVNLMNGNINEAIESYKVLANGMSNEGIFIDIIVKSIKEIGEKWEAGQLSVGEEHDALLGIQEILSLTLERPRKMD